MDGTNAAGAGGRDETLIDVLELACPEFGKTCL
jgi:hypothetical protein